MKVTTLLEFLGGANTQGEIRIKDPFGYSDFIIRDAVPEDLAHGDARYVIEPVPADYKLRNPPKPVEDPPALPDGDKPQPAPPEQFRTRPIKK